MRGTVTVQQENRISAVKYIIGIPYWDFRFLFSLIHYAGLTFLISTAHEHQQSYYREAVAYV